MNPIDSNARYPLARQRTRNKDNAGRERARTGGLDSKRLSFRMLA
jgi:hypothetical protein